MMTHSSGEEGGGAEVIREMLDGICYCKWILVSRITGKRRSFELKTGREGGLALEKSVLFMCVQVGERGATQSLDIYNIIFSGTSYITGTL